MEELLQGTLCIRWMGYDERVGCVVDSATGHIVDCDLPGLGEYPQGLKAFVELTDGTRYEVCPRCHGSVTGFLGRWSDREGNYLPRHGCPICANYHLVGGVNRWTIFH